MTEQEKREKAIEKIIKTIKEVRPSYGIILLRVCANVILDIGYRKEEEVRKEKAKEIYKAVLNLRELMVNNDDALCILRNVESWAKEDGVEVEECE